MIKIITYIFNLFQACNFYNMASKRLDDIIQAAVDNHLLNEKGELALWKSSKYQKAADDLNTKDNCKKISRDYLYILLSNNRYQLLSTLKSKYGIEVTPKSPGNLSESDSLNDAEIENESITDEGKRYKIHR